MRRLTSTLHRHLPTLVVAALVIVLRWWTSHRREVFHIRPDEPGQLAIARFVGRGARWNMFNHSTWRPAYGTLISPVTWFTDDPTTQYRAALAINALLGGVSVVLLAVLAHRLVRRSRTMAAVLAGIAVLAPAVLFTTNWVWSEGLVQVSFLLVVLAALRFHDTWSMRWGVVVVLAAALGFGTHSRLLPLSGLVVVLVLFGTFGRRLRWTQAAVLLVLLAVALFGVGRVLAVRGRARLGRPGGDEHRGRRARPSRQRRRPRSVAGRAGLVPARRDCRRRRPRRHRPHPHRVRGGATRGPSTRASCSVPSCRSSPCRSCS